MIKVGKGEKGDAEKNESGEKANIGSAPKNSEEWEYQMKIEVWTIIII